MKPVLTSLPARLRNCRGVLVDSNVLLDIATNDAKWSEWSGSALAECTEHAPLIINPIIYAEVSIGYATIEALNAALPSRLYQRDSLPWEAGFPGWQVFPGLIAGAEECETTPLPDFYIGAHAAIEHLALLTRDVARFQTYFPKVEILSPPKDLR